MTKQKAAQNRYDVFLSHNSADKVSVEQLAVRLEDETGLKPFLDKWHLVPGEPWQEAIEEALDNSAACAVFLGPGGLGSWENEEMRTALERRVRDKSFRVIPVLLPGADPGDSTTLPSSLGRMTWVSFSSGLDNAEAFRQFIAGIKGEVPGRGTNIIARSSGYARRRISSLTLLILPSFMVLLAVFLLPLWRIPTRIHADLTVNRAVFTVGGTDEMPVLNSVAYQSLTVEQFERIEFSPEKLEVADPMQYIATDDRYPETAWKPLTFSPPLIITGEDETLQPAVTLEKAISGLGAAGTLDRVRAGPSSDVSLEVMGSRSAVLTFKVEGQTSFAVLSLDQPFQLMANYVGINGIRELLPEADLLTFRAQLSSHSPHVEITGQPRSLLFTLTIVPEEETTLFYEGSIPVISLDFTRQNESGNPVTALVKNGEITYPDYPGIDKVVVKALDFIGLDRLEKFRIEQIALDPQQKGIRLRLHGIAGHIRTGSQGFPVDLRLTGLDTLWKNPSVMVLLGIMVWLFPTLAGGYMLYKEEKS